jgi:ubiquinone/menaquinone biosynthesis C-methylase UbiE
MNPDEKEAIKKYTIVGEQYHKWRTKINPKGWIYNEFLEMPSTFELMGNIKGKNILDIGCGTGIYAKKMTKMGAKVKGFDISPKMLEIAKEENPKLELKQSSLYNIPFNEKFDIAIAPLVIHYLKNLDKVFKEVNRILKSQGYFIFSISNPVFEVTEKISKNRRLVRKFGNYFKEKKQYKMWGGGIEMPSYHKTYETIIRTLLKNGFEIADYRDCFPLKKSEKLFPKEYNFLSNVPYFCAWKVRKVK